MVVRGVPKHAGVLAWRSIVRIYEPQVGGRLNAMLVRILPPNWQRSDPDKFEDDLTG